MKTIKIFALSIIMLATFAQIHTAQFRVYNHGSRPVTIKIDLESSNLAGWGGGRTITYENLQPNSMGHKDEGGGFKFGELYLLPGNQKGPNLPRQNIKRWDGTIINGYTTSQDWKDVTVDLKSEPDPKNPKEVLWTVDLYEGIINL